MMSKMAKQLKLKTRGNLLFNDLHFYLLSQCNYNYAHKISKTTTATWNSVSRILKEFESLGLIKKTKQGRSNILELTDLGKDLVKFYQEKLCKIREVDENVKIGTAENV